MNTNNTAVPLAYFDAAKVRCVIDRVFRGYARSLGLRMWRGVPISLGRNNPAATVVVNTAQLLRESAWRPDPLRLAEPHFFGEIDVEGDLSGSLEQRILCSRSHYPWVMSFLCFLPPYLLITVQRPCDKTDCATSSTRTPSVKSLIDSLTLQRSKSWNGCRKTGFGCCSSPRWSRCIYSVTAGMAVTEGTVDTVGGLAMAIVSPTPLAKTMCNALREKRRGITIDR